MAALSDDAELAATEEIFDGIVIITTNAGSRIDSAHLRRDCRIGVSFPLGGQLTGSGRKHA